MTIFAFIVGRYAREIWRPVVATTLSDVHLMRAGFVFTGGNIRNSFSPEIEDGAILSLPGCTVAQARHVDRVHFQRMGNFLRSIGATENLKYLMPLLQKYIVQRTMDTAIAPGDAPENREDEESIFFSLMDDYGQDDHYGRGWSDEDKAEVKKRSVKLVKMMRARLKEAGEDISL